ncbi:MAG: hypothetical protein ACW96U_13550 [Candidatus Heimdallarchaeaceae archaeon]
MLYPKQFIAFSSLRSVAVVLSYRIDYNLRHPPKEFWDNFKPGKEEEAMKYYKI